MNKEYYISHIILNGHLINLIYQPIPSNTYQKEKQKLRTLADKHSSNLTKKKKEYALNNIGKTFLHN